MIFKKEELDNLIYLLNQMRSTHKRDAENNKYTETSKTFSLGVSLGLSLAVDQINNLIEINKTMPHFNTI